MYGGMEITDADGRVDSKLLSNGGGRLSRRAGEKHGGSRARGGTVGRMLSLNASFSNDSPGDGGRDDDGEPSGVDAELDDISRADDDNGHRTTGTDCFLLILVDIESECWSAHEGVADAGEALNDLP